jgi:hypothetical protein
MDASKNEIALGRNDMKNVLQQKKSMQNLEKNYQKSVPCRRNFNFMVICFFGLPL